MQHKSADSNFPKILAWAWLISIIAPVPAFAQGSNFAFDIRNYLELSGYWDRLKDDPPVNPDNILELEQRGLFGEINTQFTLSYLLDYQLQADVGFQYSPGPGNQQDDETHFVTNEYFLDLFLAEKVYLKAGKKRNPWGVGWIFSPVDEVLGWARDIVDPSEAREGKYLTLLEVPIGNAALTFIHFPDVEFDLDSEEGQAGIPKRMQFRDPTLAARLYLLLWDTDVSLIYYRTDRIENNDKNYFGLTLNRYWGDVGAYAEVIGHQGNDLEFVQTNPNPAAPPAELYYFLSDTTTPTLLDSKKDDDRIYVNFALGVEYRFPDDTKVALEYLRNSEGYDDDEFKEFFDFLKHDSDLYLAQPDENLAGKILKANQILQGRLRQNYLSLTVDRPFTFDDFTPHLGVTMCLDDGSLLLNGALEWTVRDDTSIRLDVKGYVGADDAEFGLKPQDVSVFLKGTYFF